MKHYSDYELYQVLEAEGYKTDEENLACLREGLESGRFTLETENLLLLKEYVDYDQEVTEEEELAHEMALTEGLISWLRGRHTEEVVTSVKNILDNAVLQARKEVKVKIDKHGFEKEVTPEIYKSQEVRRRAAAVKETLDKYDDLSDPEKKMLASDKKVTQLYRAKLKDDADALVDAIADIIREYNKKVRNNPFYTHDAHAKEEEEAQKKQEEKEKEEASQPHIHIITHKGEGKKEAIKKALDADEAVSGSGISALKSAASNPKSFASSLLRR